MRSFTYQRAGDVRGAVEAVAARPDARFIAGGTNLLDLMKIEVETPAHLVDISRLPLGGIEEKDGGLMIGSQVRNSDLAADRRVRERYPLLAQALLAGASAQVRNKASVGGNLLQRTRCYYFNDPSKPCNKRQPGSGCAALEGYNRIHAVLGASERCIAVNPSDMAVALTALDARVRTASPSGGERTIPIGELYRLPGESPDIETILSHGELITAVALPPPPPGRQVYRKVRDRASFAFALVSVGAVLDVQGGVTRAARVAFGGLAPKPWRSDEAERALLAQPARRKAFAAAADVALQGARGRGHNDFKIALARRAMVAALASVTETSRG